ncbi:MAG: DNA methyltransferase [Halobacteriota archaeon]
MQEEIAKNTNEMLPLQIGHTRTCSCPPSHINCMTAKEWIKAQIGVWEFFYEGRDIRDKNVHPAVFPISLAKQVISLFTHQGELVIDPFVGVGTTLLAAKDIERNAVGFDLYQNYIDKCKERLSQERLIDETAQQLAFLDDAHNINRYFERDTISLAFTSPPYANLLNRRRLNKSRRGDLRANGQYLKVEQYGTDSRDLGLLSAEDYQEEMRRIFEKMLPVIKPKGHVVINIPDMWWKDGDGVGKRVPLHIHIYHALTDAGYEFRNTIIWNRNNIVNKVGIFGWPSNYITMGTTFEYLLDFWKPA